MLETLNKKTHLLIMVDKHPLKISSNHKSFYLLYFLKATYILKATQDS